MATKRDFYDVLGVSKTATDAEIKTAYRKKALEWHPDRNKAADAETKFKEINEAYQVLSDAKKKASYDQFGHAAFSQGGGPSGFGGFNQGGQSGPFSYQYSSAGGSPFEGVDFGGFSDPFEIFEQFFGGSSPFGRQTARKPHYSLRIPFMTAIKGGTEEVEISGHKHSVKIPAGTDTGTHLRFKDFDLTFEVEPHSKFKREGADVFVDQPISFIQAILGADISVPTLEGDLKVKIRPGTKPGSLIRLTGKGAPKLHAFSKNDKGDFYIRLQVTFPDKISAKQRSLLEQFDRG